MFCFVRSSLLQSFSDCAHQKFRKDFLAFLNDGRSDLEINNAFCITQNRDERFVRQEIAKIDVQRSQTLAEKTDLLHRGVGDLVATRNGEMLETSFALDGESCESEIADLEDAGEIETLQRCALGEELSEGLFGDGGTFRQPQFFQSRTSIREREHGAIIQFPTKTHVQAPKQGAVLGDRGDAFGRNFDDVSALEGFQFGAVHRDGDERCVGEEFAAVDAQMFEFRAFCGDDDDRRVGDVLQVGDVERVQIRRVLHRRDDAFVVAETREFEN